jgi:hypothetical protein
VDYVISSLGRLKSWLPRRNFGKTPPDGNILRPSRDKDGYFRTTVRKNGGKHYVRICVLVCSAWHGPRPAGAVVRHLDGTKDNDTPQNLRWGTPKENSKDQITHGTKVQGEKVSTCKLTEQDVLSIRKSDLSCTALSKLYPVNISMISKIRKRQNWAHV